MAQLRSMTGYGSAVGTVEGMEVTVELKSVNNRYLDCSVRLPRALQAGEECVKKAVSGQVSRGKVDVFISIGPSGEGQTVIGVNQELARGYYDALVQLAGSLGLETGASAYSIARFPDVLTVEKRQLDRAGLEASLGEIAGRAVAEFNSMRAREGARLKEDILEKLGAIEGYVAAVEERSPQIVAEYREKLLNRLREVLDGRGVDEQRIVTEAAIFADKTAVDEETVRLRSHMAQLRTLLEEGSPVGRKLDFLIQEFNREANTIGSKCTDAATAQVVVEIKSEIEKIREQVQNIE